MRYGKVDFDMLHRSYIFTDKKNPQKGIMSAILGMIAAVSVFLAVYFTYLNGGSAPMQYGCVILLSLIFSIIGMVLGIKAFTEKDIFRFFPIVGVVLNALSIISGGFILYIGVSGV